MPTLDSIYTALRNADAAGDSESVQKLGAFLQSNGPALQAQHQAIANQINNDPISQGARDPTQDMGTVGKFVAGYGKAGADMVRGAGQRLGIVSQEDVDENRRLDAPLMATTAGKVGHITGAVASTLPAYAAGPGLGAVLTGAALGYVQPTATGDSSRVSIPFTNIGVDVGSPVLANTITGGALAGAGVGLGKAIGYGANKLVTASAANQAANAGKTAAVQSARDAGYVLPPTDINPSPLNALAEGLSGKIKTAQAASFKNQPITNDLARKALNLPENTVITSDVLQGIRTQAGKAYAAVKNTGTVAADDTYNKALDTIASKYQGAAESFPGLAKNEIPDMVAALRQPGFDASHAVDAIGILRESADKAFRAGDTGLAKASKDAAGALEDQLGRHLEVTGQDPALIDAFKAARTDIAKSYSVNKALNPANGDVSATKLAAQLAKGKPLSGDLRTIADVGTAFPKATEALTRNPNALSPLDYMAAIANSKNSLMTGVNTLAVRPLLRGAILSNAGQKLATPSGTPNALLRLLSSDSTSGKLLGQARRSASINSATSPNP